LFTSAIGVPWAFLTAEVGDTIAITIYKFDASCWRRRFLIRFDFTVVRIQKDRGRSSLISTFHGDSFLV
jgi:hypothetical protein